MDVEPQMTRGESQSPPRGGAGGTSRAAAAAPPAHARTPSPSAGMATTPTKGRASRAATEARRAARAKPSRAYAIIALLMGSLGALAATAPATAVRLLLKSSTPAVASKHLSLARHAVSAVVEAALHGAHPRGVPASPRLSPALVPPFDTLVRALGVAWCVTGLLAWSLKNAATHSKLSMLTYRRLALALTACGALDVLTFPRLAVHLSWTGTAVLGGLVAGKLVTPWKTLRREGVVQNLKLAMRPGYTPPGAGGSHTPSSIQEAADVGRTQAALYGAAAPIFALTGLSYILLPAPTMRAVLGSATPAAACALWQALGGSIGGIFPLVALNLKMAAREHRLVAVTHMLESVALAGAGAAYVALLARDWEARTAGWAAPGVTAQWGAVAALAAGGLPLVRAGDAAPVARREE